MGRKRGQGRHPEIEATEAPFQETELKSRDNGYFSSSFFYIALTYTLSMATEGYHAPFALLFFEQFFL
jgi:hypothetical protein